MSSRVCMCDWLYIKDSVPLIEKSRASCPGGRFPPFIHQVIIITGLKINTTVCSRPEDGLRCRLGVKPPLELKPNNYSLT